MAIAASLMTRRYSSAADFKQALENQLRRKATGLEVTRRRQRLVFQRLLARIAHKLGQSVVLKGGLALELRLERARTTKDVDLILFGSEAALLERLQALGQEDHGDFLTFEIQPSKDTPDVTGEGVRYGGKRFRVEARLAGKLYGAPFGLDIVFGGHMLGDATPVVDEDYLGFAGIMPPMLLLLPVETHIAEKLHAYTLPRTSPNSRVRDLPDMALLATVPNALSGRRIADALDKTFQARATHPLPALLPAPPDAWRPLYANLAAEHRLPWKGIDELVAAVRAFVDPVLRGENCGAWLREPWSWSGPDR
jgi:nucleotidyltransferase AbiEii toxin of type IV toxin-antitoxin system